MKLKNENTQSFSRRRFWNLKFFNLFFFPSGYRLSSFHFGLDGHLQEVRNLGQNSILTWEANSCSDSAFLIEDCSFLSEDFFLLLSRWDVRKGRIQIHYPSFLNGQANSSNWGTVMDSTEVMTVEKAAGSHVFFIHHVARRTLTLFVRWKNKKWQIIIITWFCQVDTKITLFTPSIFSRNHFNKRHLSAE